MARRTWAGQRAEELGHELAAAGAHVPVGELEEIVADWERTTAERMRVTPRTARGYFIDKTRQQLARTILAGLAGGTSTGGDVLDVPRTIDLPITVLGTTIAALVEAAKLAGPRTRANDVSSILSLMSTLGVLARDHDGAAPTVRVPPSVLGAAAATLEEAADQAGLAAVVADDQDRPLRERLHRALARDAGMLRELLARHDTLPAKVVPLRRPPRQSD